MWPVLFFLKEIHIYISSYHASLVIHLYSQKNLAHTYMWHTQHWTAVSILLGLISSAHCDLHHWRSNQQPQYAEAETPPLGHWFMPRISDTELTSQLTKSMHIYIYISSSSSSCRAASADIPDRLSPFLPIIHRLRQVFRITTRVLT